MSVGAIPTVSVSFDALNINSDQRCRSDIANPAIHPVDGTSVGNDANHSRLLQRAKELLQPCAQEILL